MDKKVLLIVEGEADEVRFFRRLFKCCYQTLNFVFYPYKTNLHVLAQELYNYYPEFENDSIDIRLVLASIEQNEDKKKLLRDHYSDIFMIFDFEPQDHNPHFDTVRRMLAYFNNSAEQGKLFINYPMMQSYKHFSDLPDSAFNNKIVSIEQIQKYKCLVSAESKYTDLTKYDYKTFFSIAFHHCRKAIYIQKGEESGCSLEEFYSINYQAIFDKQVDLVTSSKKVWVLNTCILGIIEFSPRKYFNFIERHQDDLTI